MYFAQKLPSQLWDVHECCKNPTERKQLLQTDTQRGANGGDVIRLAHHNSPIKARHRVKTQSQTRVLCFHALLILDCSTLHSWQHGTVNTAGMAASLVFFDN